MPTTMISQPPIPIQYRPLSCGTPVFLGVGEWAIGGVLAPASAGADLPVLVTAGQDCFTECWGS
jgi:hypothetical protein